MAGTDGLGVSGVPAAAAKWPAGKESEVTSSALALAALASLGRLPRLSAGMECVQHQL